MRWSLVQKQLGWSFAIGMTWLAGIAGLVISIIYLPPGQVSAKLFIAVVLVAVMVIITLVHAIFDLGNRANRRALPSLITAQRSSLGNLILVLQPSALFAYESSVAVYHNKNSVENLL